MKKLIKIEGTVENWENGVLGADEEFAVAVDIRKEIQLELNLEDEEDL